MLHIYNLIDKLFILLYNYSGGKMKIAKSTLVFNNNLIMKMGINSVLFEVITSDKDTVTIEDTNVGTKEVIPNNFNSKLNIEETSFFALKATLYREIKEGETVEEAFRNNEYSIKQKCLRHIKDTVKMYKKLYREVYKSIDKFDVRICYDKDEKKPWRKNEVESAC